MDNREHPIGNTAEPTAEDRSSPKAEQQHGSYVIEAIRLVLPLLVIGIGVGSFFALLSLRKEPDKEPAKERIPMVSTTPVDIQTGGLTIKVDGTVVPYREVALSAEVAGRVVEKSELCKAGRFVRGGDALVQIDPRDYQLAVKQLEEELEQAGASIDELDEDLGNTKELIEVAEETVKLQEKELSRLMTLAEKDFATASQIDQERRNVLSGRNALFKLRGQLRAIDARRVKYVSLKDLTAVRLSKAQLELDRTTVTAPIDGVVVTDSVEVDSYVSKGAPLAVIEDISAVEVKCSLRMDELYWIWRQPPAADIDSAIPTPRTDYQIPRTPVTINYTLAGRKYTWDGELSRFEGIGLDQATRTVPCRVVVPQPRDVRVAPVASGGSPARTPASELSDQGPPALVRNMYVSVEIHAKPDASLLKVPEAAVRPGGRLWRFRPLRDSFHEKWQAFAIVPSWFPLVQAGNGKLDIVQVHVVGVVNNVATIRSDGSGLSVGDKIVVTPLPFVEDGMMVQEVEDGTTVKEQAKQ